MKSSILSLFLLQLCLYLQDHPGLLENYSGLVKKFEVSFEKMVKSKDTNECRLALKFHYYAVLLKTTGEWHKENGTIDCFIES